MTYETIEYRTADGIAYLMLNRPSRANAQSLHMIDELSAALDVAAADDSVRVLVLGGRGKNFSSGHDMKELFDHELPGLIERRSTTEGRVLLEEDYYWNKCLQIRDFPKPTIGQVQGYCLAAGFMIVSMCDLIVASEDAQFGNPVARMAGVGVEIIAEPSQVGFRKAKELLFTGDPIPAAEAHRLGMVNRVVPLPDLERETGALAKRIVLMPPFTVRMIKKALNHAQDLAGYRAGLEYGFALHQIGHTTKEWYEMHDRHLLEGKTFKEFLAWRDATFAAQETSGKG